MNFLGYILFFEDYFMIFLIQLFYVYKFIFDVFQCIILINDFKCICNLFNLLLFFILGLKMFVYSFGVIFIICYVWNGKGDGKID